MPTEFFLCQVNLQTDNYLKRFSTLLKYLDLLLLYCQALHTSGQWNLPALETALSLDYSEKIQANKQTNKQTHNEHSTRLIWLANNSGLNSIRYPSWDKVGVGQITSFLSFFIHFLHLRLNFVQEVAVIIVDKIESFHVLKVVAVVK